MTSFEGRGALVSRASQKVCGTSFGRWVFEGGGRRTYVPVQGEGHPRSPDSAVRQREARRGRVREPGQPDAGGERALAGRDTPIDLVRDLAPPDHPFDRGSPAPALDRTRDDRNSD